MWWVYIFQLPLCLNIKWHLRLQTLPRAPPTMLWLWAEPSHALSIWGTVKWSPTDLNLGLEHSSKSSEWHIDCTKLKLRSQSKLLANKYMAALRAMLKPMAYQWSWVRILPPDLQGWRYIEQAVFVALLCDGWRVTSASVHCMCDVWIVTIVLYFYCMMTVCLTRMIAGCCVVTLLCKVLVPACFYNRTQILGGNRHAVCG